MIRQTSFRVMSANMVAYRFNMIPQHVSVLQVAKPLRVRSDTRDDCRSTYMIRERMTSEISRSMRCHSPLNGQTFAHLKEYHIYGYSA